ncbi:MAG: Rpn family recombination-promoting nuclease/putative transposase [Clostridiales bacterium]|nr:Rpn family recombination-promoting nuclease/putative transposase [Clostridiales bacterium]
MAKEFQKLTIKDPFMFAAVMNDEETCRRMLETILEMQILEVTIVTEKTMDYHPDYRGVRLDVLAVENKTERRFNVEMQVKPPKNLLRRCRFYHSGMDMNALPSGTDYNELPDAYVIFICDFDPLGKKLYRYRCQMTCEETGELLNDGSRTILLSTKGTNPQDVPTELVHFLKYVGHPDDRSFSMSRNDLPNFLDQRVVAIKQERSWEAKYMLFREMLRDEREEGRIDGLKDTIMDFLSEQGEVPRDIHEQIIHENDELVLKKWIRSALKAESFDEFRQSM